LEKQEQSVSRDSGDMTAAVSQVQEYWDRRAVTSHSDFERVDQSARSQRMRFEAFILQNDLQGKSILDVGCGLGGLYERLEARNIQCTYVGFDISSEMVRRCRERFPQLQFESGDFLKWEPSQSFDYVVSFGIHNNVRLADGWKLLESVTRRQFELSSIAAYVSLLTTRYHKFAPEVQPWPPERVFSLALSITPYVALRHDYLPNDFSVTLYRQPLIDVRRDLLLDLHP
jgi:SAM-dependent methyltransferase